MSSYALISAFENYEKINNDSFKINLLPVKENTAKKEFKTDSSNKK